MSNLWTCQVCGRAIQARAGVIAHHGYRRPGQGHQTASCFGARRLPFQLAHDAIDNAIAWTVQVLGQRRERLAKHTTAPYPEKVIELQRSGGRLLTSVEHARPDDFDPAGIERAYFPRGCYASEWRKIRGEIARNIEEGEASLVALRERREEWKAPTDAQRAAWIAYAGKAKKMIRPEVA